MVDKFPLDKLVQLELGDILLSHALWFCCKLRQFHPRSAAQPIFRVSRMKFSGRHFPEKRMNPEPSLGSRDLILAQQGSAFEHILQKVGAQCSSLHLPPDVSLGDAVVQHIDSQPSDAC